MTELATRNTGRQAVVADGDLLIHKLVGKSVGTLSHGTYKDTYALILVQVLDVVSATNDFGIETQRDLAAVGRKVVRDWVLDHA